jgi:Ca2+-binding RTX toxin-like protein
MVHHISKDQSTTVQVNTMGDTWIVDEDVSINVTNVYGMLESGSGNLIKVLGDIGVSGDLVSGVRFQGADSSVVVGANSVIDAAHAQYGIYYEGAGGHITVNGAVEGDEAAIHGNIWAVVENNGHLMGGDGLVFQDAGSDITNTNSIEADDTGIASGAAGTLIVNRAGAEIVAGSTGILLTGMSGDESVIANSGLISADIAIKDGADSLTLTNTGKIVGDVLLGGGDDWFDMRGGAVNGLIKGGAGNDTFVVSKSGAKIIEAQGGGIDTVHSSADYHIGVGLDDLVLIGGKDIDGKGNKFANEMTGNKGDNHLAGLNGNDVLNGAKGNDILEGDLGADTFVFNTGSGKDTIADFLDGTDRLVSNEVLNMQDFDDLIIKQKGENVVINFGDGDTLTLMHMSKGDIDYGDFMV